MRTFVALRIPMRTFVALRARTGRGGGWRMQVGLRVTFFPGEDTLQYFHSLPYFSDARPAQSCPWIGNISLHPIAP
jgi:hypothetical protein